MNILIDGQTLETPEINRGIGSYFKNVINNMIKCDFVNKWYIVISNSSYLECLDSWVIEKINIIEDKDFSPQNISLKGYSANMEYTEKLIKYINKNNIDLYWNPNPVMINTLFPTEELPCKFFATFYDLIPMVFDKIYIKNWPKEIRDEYLRRLDYLNKEYSNLLFISESTKNDFTRLIGNNYKKGTVIFLGADSKLFYRPYKFIVPKSNYKVIYVGGFDKRKNLFGAVEAFAKSKKIYCNTIMDKTKFSIICNYSENDKEKLQRYINNLGMNDCIEIKGFVSDIELANLYRDCDLFFFPSLYEGFGLPILEAMLAGACILTGTNSSLAETSKEYAMYCDPNNIEDMAYKIYQSLTYSANEEIDEKKKRQDYALQFSWNETATKTLKSFFETIDFETTDNREKELYKLALVTPWPPQRTGIANFIYKLIPALSNYFRVDIFVDDSNTKGIKYKDYNYGNIYSINSFRELYKDYDKILYQLGNNSEFHTKIYELALEIPGVIEVHDYNINPFMYHSFFIKNKRDIYKNALLYYGEAGKKHYKELEKGTTYPDIDKFPMIHYIASKSKGVIVHSRWVAEQLHGINNVYVIPLSSPDKVILDEEFDRDDFNKKYGLNENTYIIGCLGFVNRNKRPEKIIEAVSKLKRDGYPIKLLFFGSADEEIKLKKFAKNMQVDEDIIITGFLSEKDYFESIYFSDIIINLRYPSMGESSGTLCEAFRYGKPIIVSNINQYKEYPDEVCWKVDIGDNEIDELVSYLKVLLKDKKVRDALGKNGFNYANIVLNVKTIAQLYKFAIDSFNINS